MTPKSFFFPKIYEKKNHKIQMFTSIVFMQIYYPKVHDNSKLLAIQINMTFIHKQITTQLNYVISCRHFPKI